MKRMLASTVVVWSISLGAMASLGTQPGHEVGVSVTNYKYTEPDAMSLKATKLGLNYAGTFALSDQRFARVEARLASGKADYTGTGIKTDVPDRYYEIRGLIGKDYPLGADVVYPYIGFGYRYLFNDLRGQTSTGATGYRRQSTYLSLPIGITHHRNLDGGSKLLSTAEVDLLIRGEQESNLSDTGGANQDITNRQRHGYGLRLGVAYQSGQWSVGPVMTLWRIKASNVVNGWVEPKNSTAEGGITATFRFH